MSPGGAGIELASTVLHHARVLRRFVCLVLLALAACPAPPAPVEPPHFLWTADAQSLDNPFPDERMISGGALTLRAKWYQPFLPEKAITPRAVGYFRKIGAQFSRDVTALGHFGGTLLRVSDALDPDTVQGSVARVVKEADGTWRVLERTVEVEHPRDTLAKRGATLPEGYPEFLFVRPSVPMPENHEGLLVVLRGPKTKTGAEFGRGFAWADTKPELAPVASALGVAVDDVLLTLPQHAGDITATPKALARWAAAHPPAVTLPPHAIIADDNNGSRPVGVWTPADSDWSVMQTWLEAHSFGRPAAHVGQVLVGELAAHDLRENGVFKPDWVADPSLAPVVPLRFVMAVPKGPKPAGGWPIVMAQHGVGGRNSLRLSDATSYCLEWAEALAARGLGCIGIDAPNHGSRGTFTQFFTVDDLPALRDRMREMTFDLLQVEAAVATIDLDGDGQSDVAPKVRYFGNSMGAIMGSGFIPVANRVSSAVLNVPGAGLSNVVMSRFLQDLIGLLIVGQTDIAFDSPEYLASFPLFRAVAQPLFDPGDPINVAPAVSSDIAVLLQAGIGDKVIPMDTSRDLAGALQLAPASASAGTHAFMQVDPTKFLSASQAADYNGHNVMWDFAPIREQALKFLETDGQVLLTP